MKYLVIFLILIGFVGFIIPQVFGTSENLFSGTAIFERLPVTISPNTEAKFEIKFQYPEGSYSLSNVTAIVDITPQGATSFVHFNAEPFDVYQNSIARIPVTISIDPDIEYEKIFLNISYIGTGINDVQFKSSWSDSLIFDIAPKDLTFTELPSSQDYEFERLTGARCDVEPALCYGTFYNGTTIPVQCDYRHSCGVIPFDNNVFYQSPLKQFKSGIPINEITCKEHLQLIIKNNENPACVKPDTIPKLVERNSIELSSFYQSRPLIERLHVAMAIIQFSDIPTTILGLDHDQILGIEINDEELNKIPNAQEYYEQKIRKIIPFDVPIKVTFGKYWE